MYSSWLAVEDEWWVLHPPGLCMFFHSGNCDTATVCAVRCVGRDCLCIHTMHAGAWFVLGLFVIMWV